MVFELTLPELGFDGKDTKDLVITLLLEEYPLNVRQIWRRMRKKFGKDISYQAVYKAVMSLCETGVLSKNKSYYKINIDWVFRLKTFSNKAEMVCLERDSKFLESSNNKRIYQTSLDSFIP